MASRARCWIPPVTDEAEYATQYFSRRAQRLIGRNRWKGEAKRRERERREGKGVEGREASGPREMHKKRDKRDKMEIELMASRSRD